MLVSNDFLESEEEAGFEFNPDSAELPKLSHVRQWICVPPCVAKSSAFHKPQDFQVLLESDRGRLVWFSVNQRFVPAPALIQAIAKRVDAFKETPSSETLAGDIYAHLDLIVTMLDEVFSYESKWDLDTWSRRDIAEAVLDDRFAALTCSEIRETIIEKNTNWFRRAIDRFLENLNLTLIPTAGSLRPSGYNYFYDECEIKRRNRVQAVELFPILLPTLFEPRFAKIRQVIDRGAPLIDALSLRYSVKRSIVRAVSGTAVLATKELSEDFEVLLQILRGIPDAWLPHTVADWTRFSETVRHIQHFSRQTVLTTNNRLILRDCAGRGYRPTDLDSEEWWRVGQEIDEFIRGLREAICYQHCQMRAEGSPDLYASTQIDHMLVSLGIKKVGRIARRWVNVRRRSEVAFGNELKSLEGLLWPLLVDGPLPVGTLIAYQLATVEALQVEGEVMSNCVSSYVHSCMIGACQIWSLKNAAGERVTTLETVITKCDDGNPEIRIGQHSGQGNSKPTKQADAAARELLEKLSSMKASLFRYLRWKETTPRTSLSERLFTVSVGLNIAAFEEVLPKKWSLYSLLLNAYQNENLSALEAISGEFQ